MISRLWIAVVLLSLPMLPACHGTRVSGKVNPTLERSRRLSLLAASEAGRIRDADARLTRQLNITDQVSQRFGNQDALTVLGEATKTLKEVGPELGEHARLSGWVSISQLSRRAGGTQSSQAAASEAKRELEALPDLGARCQYVMGVAEEISHAQGDDHAVALLAQGGEWAKAIGDAEERRRARLAFAIALFNLNAYDNGVAVLRNEGDAAWSSDTMLALAAVEGDVGGPHDTATSGLAGLMDVGPRSPAPVAEPARAAQAQRARAPRTPSYGKSMGYELVFQGASQSRTAR